MTTILTGDCRDTLKTIPDGTVHACITSPPYWGLRDYGTAQWEGGDAGCDHLRPPLGGTGKETIGGTTSAGNGTRLQHFRDTCGKCGAKRIDRQIGQEPTPDAYVQTMVEVFREVRRVLHDSGTVWLNVGDSYATQPAGNKEASFFHQTRPSRVGKLKEVNSQARDYSICGLKPKDLCLIPWRLAIALQADGWWVRSVICWAKKSCMPESVTDRPTNSWEPIFLLAKSAKYFYDAEAVKEPVAREWDESNGAVGRKGMTPDQNGQSGIGFGAGITSRNQRNVWHLGPEPYAEAHFATFPTEIPRRAILAGTSARGCCPKCFAPWVRVMSAPTGGDTGKSWHNHEADEMTGNAKVSGGQAYKTYQPGRTVGWEPGCDHFVDGNKMMPITCTVLDPFGGSGTTGMVATELGRKSILCELSAEYVKLIEQRTNVTPGFALA